MNKGQKKDLLKIATTSSSRTIAVRERIGPFAIHGRVILSDPAWIVSHAPTGYRVAGFETIESCQEFARRLLALDFDWTNTIDPQSIADRDDIRKLARIAYEEIAGKEFYRLATKSKEMALASARKSKG